jgi:hypothetical protein
MPDPQFSYTNDPENVSLDFVRDKIGDVDSADPLLYDGEINAEINRQPSLLIAASVCATKIASRLARDVTKQVGNDRKQSSDLFAHYTSLAAELRDEAYNGSTATATLVGKIGCE